MHIYIFFTLQCVRSIIHFQAISHISCINTCTHALVNIAEFCANALYCKSCCDAEPEKYQKYLREEMENWQRDKESGMKKSIVDVSVREAVKSSERVRKSYSKQESTSRPIQ